MPEIKINLRRLAFTAEGRNLSEYYRDVLQDVLGVWRGEHPILVSLYKAVLGIRARDEAPRGTYFDTREKPWRGVYAEGASGSLLEVLIAMYSSLRKIAMDPETPAAGKLACAAAAQVIARMIADVLQNVEDADKAAVRAAKGGGKELTSPEST